MNIRTIDWQDNAVKIIDQTKLPGKLVILRVSNIKALWKAIKELKVRGAPALGAASALGVYLGIRDSKAKNFSEFSRELDQTVRFLASSRPTARNLFLSLERACSIAVRNKDKSIKYIKASILKEALSIIEEDRSACRSLARHGAELIRNNDTILTICNAGILATIDYGTALGVIYRAKEEGKRIKVYACETRPLLQGARLTSWELKNKGIDVTLICDSMAATLMQQGKIDKVITGADRITLQGDAANKIGTYNLAVLSKFHGVPFYVAAPLSTFDANMLKGSEITIEQRSPDEVTTMFFKHPVAAKNVKVYNPAFDVTPHNLISAFITERGIIGRPYFSKIKKYHCWKNSCQKQGLGVSPVSLRAPSAARREAIFSSEIASSQKALLAMTHGNSSQ